MKAEKVHTGLRAFISSEYRNLVSFVRRYYNERYTDVTAEDIVQDVAVNLFSKLDFDGHFENIAGYVYRSIRNKIIDFQRKRKKEIPFEKFVEDEREYYFEEGIKDVSDLFFDEINDEKFYDILQKALDQLSPNQRMVFIATEMEGYTFEELSEKLEIPIGTLLSWKHRGIKRLKELIKLDDLYTRNDY